ncbi:hypothetical protein [Flavobacterium subsaxonicum]|uniref:GLPGLI family protein n=1 Tax=Flavobacterium subsaxonicum WB 4.1-42 = DSM 21790 TaxID=1121898 RepID=A0A0A2MRV8_9FLAO|nr:hypothetical protein [Flavobacterium subsaxonicum]KGO94153.1 hypothetical protein Q766_04265 [Flavobacterium subsaxonicum WB 4.1-42 = DSM 21790]
MKHLLTLLTFFIALTAYSQTFYPAKVVFTNGKTTEGYAELPKNTTLNSSVRIKAGQKGKATNHKNDDIYQIVYTTKNGNQFLFERSTFREFRGDDGEKVYEKKLWMFVKYQTSSIKYLNKALSYSINKDGDMILDAGSTGGTWAEIPLLFKRPNEDFATIITSMAFGATVLGTEKRFKKFARRYFNDEPTLVARIENGDFKSEQMYELAQAYNTLKGGQEIKAE